MKVARRENVAAAVLCRAVRSWNLLGLSILTATVMFPVDSNNTQGTFETGSVALWLC